MTSPTHILSSALYIPWNALFLPVIPIIDERTIAQPKVTVYSTPTCPYCVMAKRYLSERGVKYKDVNVAADQSRALEMLTKTGQMGVSIEPCSMSDAFCLSKMHMPVLDIGGKVIVGFDRHAIEDALSGL